MREELMFWRGGSVGRWLVAIALGAALVLVHDTARSARGDVALVVNRANPVANLSSAEVRRIFLGDMSRWPSSDKITILLLPSASEERKFFLHSALGMSDDDFVRHWISRVFQGEATAGPKTASSPASMARLITGLTSAIGVLAATDVPTGESEVKILRIDGKAPGEDGYRLKR
jgi:ABC-type phosphate transport system substrate-binding protein